MIVIFTDSSYYSLRLKSTSCMYIHNITANTENDLVKIITFEFSSFNSFHAELIGAINVLHYINEQNYNNDILVLYLDNSACLIILNTLNSSDNEKKAQINYRQKNKYSAENQTITQLLNNLSAKNIKIILKHSKAHSVSSTLLLSNIKIHYSKNSLIKDKLNELRRNINLYYNNILFKNNAELLLANFYSACNDKSSREILYFTAYYNNRILFNHIVDRIAYNNSLIYTT